MMETIYKLGQKWPMAAVLPRQAPTDQSATHKVRGPLVDICKGCCIGLKVLGPINGNAFLSQSLERVDPG